MRVALIKRFSIKILKNKVAVVKVRFVRLGCGPKLCVLLLSSN